ncbi:hypothetical protein DAI22_01g321550 [Oryza sativa Japonica Group]|nr:hypothetical protein DAI22_01g321550 [Oryza sativa Japonica Group]
MAWARPERLAEPLDLTTVAAKLPVLPLRACGTGTTAPVPPPTASLRRELALSPNLPARGGVAGQPNAATREAPAAAVSSARRVVVVSPSLAVTPLTPQLIASSNHSRGPGLSPHLTPNLSGGAALSPPPPPPLLFSPRVFSASPPFGLIPRMRSLRLRSGRRRGESGGDQAGALILSWVDANYRVCFRGINRVGPSAPHWSVYLASFAGSLADVARENRFSCDLESIKEAGRYS